MRAVLLSPDLGMDRLGEAEARLRSVAQVLRLPTGKTIMDALAGVDAYLCVGFAREFPEDPIAYGRVRLVQTTLAGVDHLPWERIPEAVTVCGNAGAYDTALAEHAFALLLAAAKRVVRHATSIRSGAFEQDVPSKPLRGSTLGVLGLGGIGKEVARLGRAFGMRVEGITRSGRSDFPADFIGAPGELDTVLGEADFLVIAVPHTKETHHLIDADRLRRMKADAVLVNVARGDIVKEDDLFAHLRDVPTFVAASDVWWRYPKGAGYPYSRPFHDLRNFLGTPHVAWNVPQQRMEALACAVDNVLAWLEGLPVRNRADPADYR
ncbi:MAG TPA: NAD(P)-dependent oxidoreductase [Thermoplasmata archaeon]|nr:NAD(P)-dependent oxidoreductase [Thermoplasmata archaeon]